MSSVNTLDPTQPMRAARQQARIAAISRDQVVEVIQQLLLDATVDQTNALTLALQDCLDNPPEDAFDLEAMLRHQPPRLYTDIGRAFLRLVGEAWLSCVRSLEDTPF